MLTIFIISLGVGAALAMSEKKIGNKPASPVTSNMELMKPGREHQQIVKMAGNWDASCKFWMDPNEQLVEAIGTMTLKPILDGRYLEGEFRSTIKGQPFTGRSVSGFNRVSKQFQYVWYDSMGTGITCLQGPDNSDGKSVIYTGEMSCPIKGLLQLRQVETFVSHDHFTHVMYQTSDGKETKTMEVNYTRQK